MAALCVGVWRAQTIVCVTDERGRCGGGHERLAGDGVYPVGCAGASGKIMRDGLRISCVLSHQAKERREGGPRVAEAFIDMTVTPFSFTHLRTRFHSTEPFAVFPPTCFQRGPPFSFSHLPFRLFHSPWLYACRSLHHASGSYVKTHLTHQGASSQTR
jgi:hypothetical protein